MNVYYCQGGRGNLPCLFGLLLCMSAVFCGVFLDGEFEGDFMSVVDLTLRCP